MVNDNRKMLKPLVFYYFDTDGIESLYSQTVSTLPIETIKGREFEKKGKLLGRIGIGKLLGSAIGLGEIGGEGEVSASGKTVIETKSIINTEQKLFSLISYISKSFCNEYFTNLGSAAAYCTQKSESAFINISNKFDMPQFYSYTDPYSEINKSRYISFYIGPPLPKNYKDEDFYADDYFKPIKSYSFFMNTSIEKCPRIRNGILMPLGHDAVFFKNFQGKSVPLNVFGYLIPLGSLGKSFQIKPYAIWIN